MKCSTDRNNIRKIIENNCYVLEFVKKASPSFIFLTCAISLTAFVDTVSNTWFSKIVFDSMEQRSPFSILVVTILTLFFFMLLSQAVEIEFCKVSFSYPGTEHVVLDKVDLHFSAGKKHAIVGHNGAGKSTIIKLILRLYDVDQGMILVNSRNIKEYNVFSLRRAVTTVFQDFQVYAVPVADYVLAHKYNEDTEKDKIAGALRDAGLSQEIQDGKLPFASTLTREFDESGIILSGGQTQKLAIARAIVKGCGSDLLYGEGPGCGERKPQRAYGQ